MKIVKKPWGSEEIWAHNEKYVGKILNIKAGHKLSLQHHEIKDETIRVLSGQMNLLFGSTIDEAINNVIYMPEGCIKHIPAKTIHRMIALTDVKVLEVSTSELDDVVRHLDDYNR